MKAERQATVERWRTNIPRELQELDQWVIWANERTRDRDGRELIKNKVPYCVTGEWRRASATDMSTWSSFGMACKVYLRGVGQGVSFAFSEHDPYCGVDFDHCVVDGVVEGEKSPYVWDLNSYTEKSQSGTGIHVIVKATLTTGRKSTEHGIEMYDRARFFVMTGDMLGLDGTINEAQETVDYMLATLFPKPAEAQPQAGSSVSVDDEKLLQLMFTYNRNTPALWRGEIHYRKPSGEPDHSAADFALLGCLNFWTANDIERTKRLFMQSQLYRPDEKGKNYLDLSARKAMGRNVYKGR